MKQVITNWIVI